MTHRRVVRFFALDIEIVDGAITKCDVQLNPPPELALTLPAPPLSPFALRTELTVHDPKPRRTRRKKAARKRKAGK